MGFYSEKYAYCEEAVEKLWGLGSKEKLEAVELAYKTAARQIGAESENLVDQNDSVRFEGR